MTTLTTGPARKAPMKQNVDAPARPIRVLFVNDHLGYEGGILHGVTRYFLNVIPRLDRRIVEPRACFLRGSHPAEAMLRERGVEPIFLGRGRNDPRSLWDLIRLVRQHRIDVLHLSGMKSILLGRLAARWTGCRTVIHLHDTQSLGRTLGFLQRRLASCTDAAIGVSGPVRQLAIDEFAIPASKAETLYNGLNIEEFANPPPGARAKVRAEFGIDEDAPVLGILGRMSAEKQHSLLIRSMPPLLAKVPGAILLIVGDGVLRAECEALVARLGVGASVRFPGQRADVPSMLAAMDLLTIPSSREGFCFVALEACAAGVPIVAFSVGGLPEIVAHEESGLLIEPQNGDALVEGLIRVMTDRDLRRRFSDASRRQAVPHSVERHVRRLESLYQEILAR